MAGDTLLLRRINEDKIRRVLWKIGESTKPQLAKATGLSQMTVASVLRFLQERGEVREKGSSASAGGRPSAVYQYQGEFACGAVVFSFQEKGSTILRFSVVDLLGRTLWQQERSGEPPTKEEIAEGFRQILVQFPQTRFLGLGMPGEACEDRIRICDYEDLNGEDFLQSLQQQFHMPVFFYNDVNAAAYGNYCRHGDEKDTAGIYFPRKYLPGMGLVLEGNLHTGHRNMAGEIGCLPFLPDWKNFPYEDGEAFSKAVTQLLVIIYSVVAPSRMVVYGEFLSSHHKGKIEEQIRALAGELPGFEVELKKGIRGDFTAGMKELVLTQLQKLLSDTGESGYSH